MSCHAKGGNQFSILSISKFYSAIIFYILSFYKFFNSSNTIVILVPAYLHNCRYYIA